MTALVAAVLFLLYPGTFVAEARAGIEIPSIFTVLLFVLALYSAVEKGSLWRYWAAGLLLGLAVLVRSEVLLFPLVLLVYFLFAVEGRGERRKEAKRIAALVFGAVVVMSPWMMRNYLLVHEFVPTATVAGVAAQGGLHLRKRRAGRTVLDGANEGRLPAGRNGHAAGEAVPGSLLPAVLRAAG